MAWYWIVLIVLASLFALTFIVYITNADMKLVQVIYNKLIKYHDSQDKKEHL